MKSVSIDELRQSTESIVREASHDPTLVTDHGQVVAVIEPAKEIPSGRRFPPGPIPICGPAICRRPW